MKIREVCGAEIIQTTWGTETSRNEKCPAAYEPCYSYLEESDFEDRQ